MTREEARKAAEVMLAFAEGKKIEICLRSRKDKGWSETADPIWDWDMFDYRVVPEPWQGKIWVHPDGHVINSDYSAAHELESGGWRLITVKEVADE